MMRGAVTASAVALVSFSSTVKAAPTAEELYAMVQALQGRIAVLESEVRTSRREAALAKDELRRLKGKAEKVDRHETPLHQAGMSSHFSQQQPSYWDGFYIGGSLAGSISSLRADQTAYQRTLSISTGTSYFCPPCTIGTYTTETNREYFYNAHGDSKSALGLGSTFFGGYSFVIRPRFVTSIQLEAGHITLDSTVVSLGKVRDISTTRTWETVGGVTRGPRESIWSNTWSWGGVFVGRATWQASAVGRVGFLIDPRVLLFATSGWTVVNFENEPRRMHGPMAGIGAEVKLDDRWSLGAEFRYTYLLEETINNPAFALGSNTVTAYDTGAKVGGSFQTLRVNVSRYFQ